MSDLPGFTVPGGPVDKPALLAAWRKVYLTLFILRTPDSKKRAQLEQMKDLLAQADELVEILLA